MSEERQLELENSSGVEKKIWDDKGVCHKIGPYSVSPWPIPLARLFLEQHPRYVREYTPTAIPAISGEEVMWIANNSGNPFLPDRVWVGEEAIDNQVKIPCPLKFTWHPGQIIVRDKEAGDYALNQLPQQVTLPCYKRIAVSQSVALWMLNRDALQVPQRVGRVVRCREPSPFEPNETWTLDDMIVYANMVDETYFHKDRLRETFPTEDAHEDKSKIPETKQRLWRFLFFRLIDDQWGLPTRDAFERRKKQLIEAGQAARGIKVVK